MAVKSMNNETRAKKAINLINQKCATWKDVSKVLGLTVSYIQGIVKDHYKTEKAYNNLLAKARANKKAKEEAQQIISEDNTPDEVKEVIVTETGYLLEVGVSGVLSENLDVYIPGFCIGELEKLANVREAASALLTMYWSTRRVKSISLRGREELYVDPIKPVKDRVLGVVALCVELHSRNYKVRLLTTSYGIAELAKLQDCGIDVVYVRTPR